MMYPKMIPKRIDAADQDRRQVSDEHGENVLHAEYDGFAGRDPSLHLILRCHYLEIAESLFDFCFVSRHPNTPFPHSSDYA